MPLPKNVQLVSLSTAAAVALTACDGSSTGDAEAAEEPGTCPVQQPAAQDVAEFSISVSPEQSDKAAGDVVDDDVWFPGTGVGAAMRVLDELEHPLAA